MDMAEKEVGEGDLHHGWFAARRATNRRVEIVFVDSDVCMRTLLCFACDPSARGIELVVRQQRGEYGRNDPHIKRNTLFHQMCHEHFWPQSFGVMNKCLQLIAAYIRCGTDCTPTLRSLTTMCMLEPYRGYALQPGNAAFVKRLGAGWTGTG